MSEFRIIEKHEELTAVYEELAASEEELKDQLEELIKEVRAQLVGPVRQELLSGIKSTCRCL